MLDGLRRIVGQMKKLTVLYTLYKSEYIVTKVMYVRGCVRLSVWSVAVRGGVVENMSTQNICPGKFSANW